MAAFMRTVLCVLSLSVATSAFAAPGVDEVTASAVIQRCLSIYREPVDGKVHPCACPFNTDKAGNPCGRRSAHDRPGGASPVCLKTEITPELVTDFRGNAQAKLRELCQYEAGSHGRELPLAGSRQGMPSPTQF